MLDVKLKWNVLIPLIVLCKSVPDLEATEVAEMRRKPKPRKKVLNALIKMIERLGGRPPRTFTPAQPPREWDDDRINLSDFLRPHLVEKFDLSANFRNDIKCTTYKSNIIASALNDGNVAASDWVPSFDRKTSTGEPVLLSVDGRQRWEAQKQFIMGKYKYVFDASMAAGWLKQYDGLYFNELPLDAQLRVEKIQLRMRICRTHMTKKEEEQYFLARQQTTVTQPGERLKATAYGETTWASNLFEQLNPTMSKCGLGGKGKDKRSKNMTLFTRLAMQVLPSNEEYATQSSEWVSGRTGKEQVLLQDWLTAHSDLAMEESEALECMQDAFEHQYALRNSFITSGKGLKMESKKLSYLCSRIQRHPQRKAIVSSMHTHPFTISPRFVDQRYNSDLKDGAELLDEIDAHCEKIIRPKPSPAHRPRKLMVTDATVIAPNTLPPADEDQWYDAVESAREQLLEMIVNATGN